MRATLRLAVLFAALGAVGCDGRLSTRLPDGALAVAYPDGGPDAEPVISAPTRETASPGVMPPAPAPTAPDAGAPPPASTPAPRAPSTPSAPAPRAPSTPSPPACAHHALLAWGLHPRASDALRCVGVTAPEITQTIGTARASAGYHLRDGYASGQPYCAATDLSVRGKTQSQIRALVSHLADYGFAAWYRWPGHDGWPSSDAPHIHAVYSGVPMKSELEGQVSDWLRDLNGLASHTRYTFFVPSARQKDLVRALYAHRH